MAGDDLVTPGAMYYWTEIWPGSHFWERYQAPAEQDKVKLFDPSSYINSLAPGKF